MATRTKKAPTFTRDELAALDELRAALPDPATLALALRSLAKVMKQRKAP